MKKIFSLPIVILLICDSISAQIITNKQFEDDVYASKVKLVDEFIKRFDGMELYPGLDTTQQDYKRENILRLFDYGTIGINESDSTFKERESFADAVLKHKVTINYSDTTWMAVALCTGDYKGEDVDLTLNLTVEKRGENMYKWVINKAFGNILRLQPKDTARGYMIMPDDHEVNFMVLNDITSEEPYNILNYRQKSYELDQTAVFFTFVNTGQLKIKYVSDLLFVFFQVPGWMFTVRKYDRMTKNAGWLITSLSKMTDKEKTKYLQTLYHKKCER